MISNDHVRQQRPRLFLSQEAVNLRPALNAKLGLYHHRNILGERSTFKEVVEGEKETRVKQANEEARH